MPKHSIFNNFLAMFSKLSGKKNENLSATQALTQQAEYVAQKCNTDLTDVEPYLQIALQLTSPKQEVFDAALYYLQKIAINNTKLASDIIELLKHFSGEHHLSQQNYASILQTIHNIEEAL